VQWRAALMEALGGSRGGDGWQPPPGIKLESLPLEDLARLVVTNIVPSSVYGREAFAIELGMALLEGGEAAMRKAEVVTERHAPRQQLQHTMLRALVATGLVAADDPRLHSLSAEQVRVFVCLFVGQPVLLHRSSAPFVPIHTPFHARSRAHTPQKRHTRARGRVPTGVRYSKYSQGLRPLRAGSGSDCECIQCIRLAISAAIEGPPAARPLCSRLRGRAALLAARLSAQAASMLLSADIDVASVRDGSIATAISLAGRVARGDTEAATELADTEELNQVSCAVGQTKKSRSALVNGVSGPAGLSSCVARGGVGFDRNA
jgi:hypothetical protein